MRTEGERLFEEYLTSRRLQNFEYERSFRRKSKRPDYTLTVCLRKYLFDVKDFKTVATSSGRYDPYRPVREKINQASKKFKEFKQWPCSLVLYNRGGALVHLMSPDHMFASMYGDISLTWDVDISKGVSVPNSERGTFGKGGKMIRPRTNEPQNTTISSLISLRHLTNQSTGQRGLGVSVWHNVTARRRLPSHLFRGTFDEEFDLVENSFERTFAGNGVLNV